MIGKVVSGMISVILITFLIILITFYFLQENLKVEVNRISYQTVEIVSTKGYFSDELYDELKEEINKYGNFNIQLKLDKFVKTGVYDTYYHPDEIIDRPLEIGDRVTVFIEDQHSTIFARLLTSGLSMGRNNGFDQRIKSLKTGIVAKNYKDTIKGYDVISDIFKYSTNDDVALFVVTKLNPEGKYYGRVGHPDVAYTNLYYGDQEDEKGNRGINYIFDNGTFYRKINHYPNGEIKLINYIQQ